jgi:hypothetical protein
VIPIATIDGATYAIMLMPEDVADTPFVDWK